MAGNREAIMTGGFLFVCGNEARASEVSLCPDAAGMFLFYFILFFNTWQLFTVNNRNVRCGVTEEKAEAGGELTFTFSEKHDEEEQKIPAERRER